jgi:carboxymethylenebutenolidase
MTDITIQAKDGTGDFYAYMAEPQTDQPAAAVIVIQEIFGVNGVMREITDSLAQSGYIAICPDLFWRQEPGIVLTDQTDAEWQRAFELFGGFDVDKGIEDLIASLDYARGLESCNGLVGDIGFCLGGKLAFLMAARSDADCSVSYYGVGLEELLDEAKNITHPLLMHIADQDKFSSDTAQAQIHAGLKDNELVSRFVYEGNDHAFARVGGEHYDTEAAQLANMRTSNFLATYLGQDA